MNEEEMTICDRCAIQVPVEITSTPEKGQWEGATLCPDCYAEVEFESVSRPKPKPTDAE